MAAAIGAWIVIAYAKASFEIVAKVTNGYG